MTSPNVERGDTFVVQDRKFESQQFTCVGVHDGYFFAGGVDGSMWKFSQLPGDKYGVRMSQGPTWGPERTISAETIIRE